MRPGAFALSLLSDPLNVQVLNALEEEPRSLRELQQLVGVYAPTAMRNQLRPLADQEVVIRRPQPDYPGLKYELGPAGSGLLEVGRFLRDWLAASPEGPLVLGGMRAKGVVKALVQGWNSKIIRALVARPLSLSDLNRLLPAFNYPSLKRQLGDLRHCRLIESRSPEGKGPPYGPSRWLRQAGGPLITAAWWERRHAAAEVAEGRFDFEAVFLLASLGKSLSDRTSGRCRLGVELRTDSREPVLAGVQLQVVEGRVISAMPRVEGEADASASGTSSAWVRALMSGQPDNLYLSGDRCLAREVIEEAHRQLFGAQRIGQAL